MSQNRLTTARLIAASLLSVLACAGLGAFGGCDLGMVEAARGTSQNVTTMILVGVSIGLLVGLAASFWDKSWARQIAPIWRRFALRFSYAAVWLLLALLSVRADWTKAHNWMPVRIPIRFDKQNTVSATFTADASNTYNVQIDLKRNLPFEDINALVGGWADPDKPPHAGPPRPEIVWTVNNVAEVDRSTSWGGQYWGETVGLEIGHFKAVAGQRYTVTVQVIKPSPAVQVLDLHLQVALTYILQPLYYVPAFIAQIGGVIAAGIGLVLMLRAIAKLRAEKKDRPDTKEPNLT
ncbi:MAG: hypothetical protein JWL77_6220 [Chthonomonadaceae bacterium]|nr:hypothetical protein [Chthonomonadaceae bacterium]